MSPACASVRCRQLQSAFTFRHAHQLHSTEASHAQSADDVKISQWHSGKEVGLCLQPTGNVKRETKWETFVSFRTQLGQRTNISPNRTDIFKLENMIILVQCLNVGQVTLSSSIHARHQWPITLRSHASCVSSRLQLCYCYIFHLSEKSQWSAVTFTTSVGTKGLVAESESTETQTHAGLGHTRIWDLLMAIMLKAITSLRWCVIMA